MIEINKDDLDQDEIKCFLHIPKTGGQTLWSILEEQKDSFLVSHGEYFKKFTKPFTYFTILRDPIDRVISTYYYIKSYDGDPLHDQVKNMSIHKFVDYLQREELKGMRFPQNDLRVIHYRTVNLATRYITGGDLLDLEKAKENIQNYFSVVGLTERYKESLFLMTKTLNFNDFTYNKHNVTPNRPNISEISPDIIDSIMKANQLDVELYNWAKQKFDQTIVDLDQDSKHELDEWLSTL